jgi:DNA-binding transcriptional regulator GbsR (MarR family)
MEKEQRWFQEKHFIEDVGLLLEQSGLPRMAGRILGLLLICNPPHQSPSELAETLHASKGSISTMTRLLIEMGLIERIAVPERRRDYFRIKPGAWSQIIMFEVSEVATGRQLAERGLALVENQPPELQERLKEAHDLYVFLEREYPLLIERWEKEREKNAGKKKK